MIRREREKREAERPMTEAELQRLSHEKMEIVRDEYEKARDSAGEENKRFLKEIKIPEYLQGIIDEERPDGAYVLWWLKHPGLKEGYGQPRAFIEEVLTSSVEKFVGHTSMKNGRPFFTRLSLVWEIGYIEEVSSGYYTDPVETEHGSAMGWQKGGPYRDGYRFKAVNVDCCAEKGILTIHGGATKWDRVPEFGYSTGVEKWVQTPNEITLYNNFLNRRNYLNQQEVLEEALASVYLDTSSWLGNFEVKSINHKDSWPFDKLVPEQEQKRDSNKKFAIRIKV